MFDFTPDFVVMLRNECQLERKRRVKHEEESRVRLIVRKSHLSVFRDLKPDIASFPITAADVGTEVTRNIQTQAQQTTEEERARKSRS